MFKKLTSLSIAKKIPAIIASVAIVSVLTTGILSYLKAESALEHEVSQKLEAVLDARHLALNSWFSAIEGDIDVQVQNPVVRSALKSFSTAWKEIEGNPETTLQRIYIDENPNPTGQKENLDAGNDGSRYSSLHRQYHPYLRSFLKDRGYYDIFLFDTDGNLVYSVYKEFDYATNLVNGKWADSDLGKIFRDANNNHQNAEYKTFYDFKAYAPSHGAPASFIAKPVLDIRGNYIGVLAFQMPLEKLNIMMQHNAGLGETGETYLVGSDKLMRSDSRFSKESTILKRTVDTEQVRQALAGKGGNLIGTDYRGIDVVAAFEQIEFKGTTWAIIAEIDVAEAFASIYSLRNTLLIGALIGLAILLVIGVYVGRGIALPIEKMTNVMKSLAAGRLEEEIPFADRKDEIGSMANAVQIFKDNALNNLKLEAEQADQKKLSEERETAARESAISSEREMVVDVIGRAMSAIVDKDLSYRITDDLPEAYHSLKDNFNEAIDVLASTIEQIGSVSSKILSSSKEIQSASDNLSRRTEQQAASVEETAAAVEQITATVKTSTDRAVESSKLVTRTKENAEQSGEIVGNAVEAMGRIESSSTEIENIIGVIDEISFQTNLLALNAGVEAARAGDAGRGFAVVAQEVRELAQRSAKAAKEIKNLITASGEEVKNGVKLVNETGTALESIGVEVQEINQHVHAIVDAAREQSSGLQEINQSVNTIDEGTQQNAAMAEQCTAASILLADDAAKINTMLIEFKVSKLQSGLPVANSNVANIKQRPKAAAPVTNGNTAVAVESWNDF
ncbi:MAG: HAMP domain-containing protein [Rhizobiaceae bacterium]|nr:HAMP domain-containing protein [Rhizobiaceae bacterium]MBL4731349.1 HAMP domain-containing protein [Rhizobiaceae bacterium]